MNRHFVFFAFALLIALFTIAPCWGTIGVDIAIFTRPNWISQQAADREANEIVSRVRNSVNDIRIFTMDQESQLASWVQSHTNNGQLDVLILFGWFPDSIYPSGNKQTDGSIAEKFLEAGNMIINTADYMFWIPYNGADGLENMMDLQDVTMWFGGDMKVTNAGSQYLPGLSPYRATRALTLDGIKSPWTVEAVFGQNTEGTLAEPVVVRDTVTGGRLVIFYQLINDDAPRGEVISEFILNWLPAVAGGTAEPGNGDVTPPVTPGEFVLMGTDPDEDPLGILADIHQVFASSDASQVKFKVTTYRNWGEYADFYVDMDVDQNPNTGYPENGVDYSVYVSRRGGNILGALWFYDPSQRDYVATNAWIDVLLNPNSNVFQVYVDRSDLGDPDAIDFEVWLMEGDLLDVAPNVGFYTYELDGAGPVDGDTTPLTITSGPLVSNVTSSSALVSWSTDEASDSVVQYGKTSAYGLTATGADNVREHSVLLTSLSPDTTYYYRAGSTDSSGNTVWSIQRSFKTSAQGVIPPIGQGGPVIYLPFNEGSGTLATDATANGNNGTLQGNVTWVNGKYGKAIYIDEDSADNMVVVRDSNTLDVTDEMTMAAWVYVESIPNLWSVIAIKDGSYMLHIQSSEPDFTVGLVLNMNGSIGAWPDSSVAETSMNQWHHVVGVYDGDKQYTYIDGELKGTSAKKGTIDVTDSDLVIGHDSRSCCNYRKTAQVIDEFMIFNRALSQAEIQQIMGGTIPSDQPPDGTPSITASPSSVKPGQDISVSYSNAPADPDGWTGIGMYPSGASNEEWLLWKFLLGEESGTLTFKAPAEAGNYEFRMFDNDKYDPSLATSNTVAVSSGDSGGVVTSGRVAYWPLDSNVNDAVGNHNGTVAGGATFVNDASRGMVFKVDGVNGHAVVPHASDITFSDSDSFTVSLWVKVLKLLNRWTAVVYKSREAGPWYGLWIDPANRWTFGSSYGSNLQGSLVETNAWHHIALVQQGKNSGNKRIIYLNGSVDGQATAARSDGPGKLWMGGSATNTWNDYLDGLIDDVTIYNRALTSEEVKALAAGGGGTTPPPTGKKLTIPEVAAEPGDSVTVPINVDDASGLAGADITVTYNSSILMVDQVKSTTLSAGMNLVPNTNIPGKIILRMAGNAIVSVSGSIVDMIFTVSSSISEDTETPVSFESAEAYDANGQNIPISTQNGKVKIASPRKKGDVNNDKKINAADAILALRISAGLRTATPEELWAADINGDGKVKSNDAIIILREASKPSAPGREFIASGGRKTSVALGEVHGIAGESITLPLRVDDPNILAGGDISIAYDSSVLRAVSVSSGSDMLLEANLAEPGLVHIAFANSGGLDDDAIATLEFEIKTDDVSPLALRDVELYGGDALPIDVRKIDGQFVSWAMPPEHSALLQNFPNPFNPETWIPYQLREDSEVTIRIYDTRGGLVRGLELGHRSAGLYVSRDRAAYWDGRNETGEPVASGVYFYTIQAGGFAATRKMIIAR